METEPQVTTAGEQPGIAAEPAGAPAAPPGQTFASSAAGDEISFVPSTLSAKDRTVDVVWYGGMTVPRTDEDTGEDYMLRLDMAGCRMARLNAGAPVFDCHMSGLDFKSFIGNQAGSKAQRGSVVKAWADGPKGMATLQFGVEGENEDTDRLWSGIASGRVRNLSFGTWIYNRQPVRDGAGNGMTMPHPHGSQAPVLAATDWEPFEISAVTVPADFTTQFLSAQGVGTDAGRATSPKQERTVMEPTTQPGTEARNDQVVLDAARAEGAGLERKRVADITALGASFKFEKLAAVLVAEGVSVADAKGRFAAATEIRTIGVPMAKHGITEQFITGLIDSGATLEAARGKMLDEIARVGAAGTSGKRVDIHTELSITRDGADTQGQRMQAALLLRHNPNFFAQKDKKGVFLAGCGDAEHRTAQEMAREYTGFSLLEMGREYLDSRGVKTRGMDKMRVAELCLRTNRGSDYQLFDGGAESTSDFPAILANVANKTLRQAYQAYPQTFKPFCRQVTAADFKPINRVQLSDAPSLQPLNEKGEYHRANLTDSNVSYSLATFGEVVALTRKVIINDDLQAFTRVPAILGVAAARLQSDKVWAVITGNPSAIYAGDTVSTALFAAGHKNLFTGGGSALGTAGLAQGRTGFRNQIAPQGTPLNLTPRYIVLPAALETTGEQIIYPMNLAVTALTAGVPEWVRSLVPIIEPRLDVNSTTAWYLIADPADIDTIEYCFLEGQEGVYFETRQGFEVDGIEMKARMDFAAAAIDYRGLQENAGV